MQHRSMSTGPGNMPYSPNSSNYASPTNGHLHQAPSSPSLSNRGLTLQQHQYQQSLWRQNSSPGPPSSFQNPQGGPGVQISTHSPQIHQYHPEVISIQVKNGRRKSLETPNEAEPIYGTTSTFLPLNNGGATGPSNGYCRKNGDDGEITPTNEYCPVISKTATLPRLLKNKPLAKVMGAGDMSYTGNYHPPGSTNGMGHQNSSAVYQQQQQNRMNPQGLQYSHDGYKSLPRDIGRHAKHFAMYQQQQQQNRDSYMGAMTNGNSSMMSCSSNNNSGIVGGKLGGPPPPPRRASCTETGSNHSGSSSTLQSSGSWTNLPPPPPALSCDSHFR